MVLDKPEVALASLPALLDHSLNINLHFKIVFANSSSEIPSHKPIKIFFSIFLKIWKSYLKSSNVMHRQTMIS